MTLRRLSCVVFFVTLAWPLLAEDPVTIEVIQQDAADVQQAVVVIRTKDGKAADAVEVVVTQAAGGAVVVRSTAGGSVAGVREQVDRDDPVERFLLLTPGAPLVVEASIMIDGKSFRHLSETLVDEMLVAADTDKDGRATWAEALKSPRFTLGRLGVVNDNQLDALIKSNDSNMNTLVDAAEARRFLAQYSQGPAFVVGGGYGYGGAMFIQANGRLIQSGGATADVKSLLDTDQDGALSAEEIAAAGERLKSRDANDDDLVDANELNGAPAATGARTLQVVNRGAVPAAQSAVLLGPAINAPAVFAALVQQYKNQDDKITSKCFAALPGLFESLDENKDGELQQNEVLGLNKVAPHLQLAVNFGKHEGSQPISLTQSISPPEAGEGSKIQLKRPGFDLALSAAQSPAQRIDYTSTANQYLPAYDKDKNNYLDETEMAGGNLAVQFKLWDADGDGKVYVKEIAESYARSQRPQMSQVRATVANRGSAVFENLDQTGDGRLSLRELRTAHERLKSLDKNSDGRIDADEVPMSLDVSFAQGGYGYQYTQTTVAAPGPRVPGRDERKGPDWFQRMDRNGDGDVTLKEFPGTEEQFKKLDINADGFVERLEADAVK